MRRSPSKLPFLLNLMVSPSLTPLGITIYYLAILFILPLPLQEGQNPIFFDPSPLHDVQVVFITNGPCLTVCIPLPLQGLHFRSEEHSLHLLPLQVSHLTVLLYSTD